jgi:hypothetical protein
MSCSAFLSEAALDLCRAKLNNFGPPESPPRLPRRCWPIPTSASPKSRTASASHRRRSIGTPGRANREYAGRMTTLYPTERPFQEGFSLAAGGGSAPTPDLAPMTMEAGAVIGKARETDGIAVAAIVSGG